MRANISVLMDAAETANCLGAKALEAELLGAALAELETVYDGIRTDGKVYGY
jgi:hypothetical protein